MKLSLWLSEEEIVAEDIAKEESSEVTKEANDAEVEADSTSESNSISTWFIVIFAVLILGGAISLCYETAHKDSKVRGTW